MVRSWFRRERPGLPDGWETILDRRSAQWRLLDGDERVRLGELADHLLRTKRWEAARGLELTDEVRTLVAGHAALLGLGLDESRYDAVRAVVIRRGALRKPPPTPTWGPVGGVVDGSPSMLDGEAHDGHGPLMVNWTSFRREAANLRLGRDVVLHEFAHKLDMNDLSIDGTPLLANADHRQRWVEVCGREFDALQDGPDPDGVLRSYAGTSPAEFFAVTTEVFFTRATDLAQHKPALYEVFATFYGQDPASRAQRAIAS